MGGVHNWNLIKSYLLLVLKPLLAVVMVILFQCHVMGYASTEGSSSTHKEMGSPSFLDTRKEVQVAESAMAILPCAVKNLGERQIVWRNVRTDEFLSIGSLMWTKDLRIIVEMDYKNGATSAGLIVRNVKMEDGGLYECQVTSVELLKRRVELQVFQTGRANPRSQVRKEIPVGLSASTPVPSTTAATTATTTTIAAMSQGKPLGNEKLFEAGDAIRLECNTSLSTLATKRNSVHPRNLKWSKDGRPVHLTKHVIVTHYHYQEDGLRVSQLFIDRADVTDSGEYLCYYRNHDPISVTKITVLPTPDRLQSDTADEVSRPSLTSPTGNGARATHGSPVSLLQLQSALTFVYWIHYLLTLFHA